MIGLIKRHPRYTTAGVVAYAALLLAANYDAKYEVSKLSNDLSAFREGRGNITCHYPGRALPGMAGYDLKNVPTNQVPNDGPVGLYFEERIRSHECDITQGGRPIFKPSNQAILMHIGGAG